jgi:hypothetical protein
VTEKALYDQLAPWLKLTYPNVQYHFDLSGVWTPSHQQRNLYGRLNKRAWPDLFIAVPRKSPSSTSSWHSGLFLELKREGTRLKTRDGRWASDHIAEQAVVLEELNRKGYRAEFAVGFADAAEKITLYMEGEALSHRPRAWSGDMHA